MADAFDIIIFGGAGDLALGKLIPALYRAFLEDGFSNRSRIIACCHQQVQADNFIELVNQALRKQLSADECSEQSWQVFKQALLALRIDVADTQHDSNKDPGHGWPALASLLAEQPARVRVFYLAIPPTIYAVCCENLSAMDLITERARIVVEKPIGYDAKSAAVINAKIAQYFDEKAIYRIDHYLGKETVQNLLVLRFTNVMFERLWDANSIDHVQISISETVGVAGRANFYNDAGALRDMVQNHLLQLLCLVAMESPAKLNEQSIRNEKIKVLESLRPLVEADVDSHTVRGQYVAGNVDGELVQGYLEELSEPHSSTETFVAIKAHIDNWRWAQVPFYLRTGKRMKTQSAEIVIQFKDISHRLYDDSAGPMLPNRLIIRLQPKESIQLTMMTKNLQKLDMELKPLTLNLNFSEAYQQFHSDAYKRLIMDATIGNASLFIHRDEVSAAWAWIDPIIARWQQTGGQPDLYRAGSWGPRAAAELMSNDGRDWRNAIDSDS